MSTALREKSEEEIVRENTPLIWSVVRRFFGRGTEADDLFQIGSIGLLKAARGFDESFGTQFSTYAVPKIAGEIKRFLRDDGMIKVSRSLKENATKINAAKMRLEHELGREPYLSEISEATGIEIEDIAASQQATQCTFSIDAQMGDDGATLSELIGKGIEENLVESIALREAISRLPEKERCIIAMRFYRDMTQQKIAQALNISQVQVSRMEKRAIEKIRKYFIDG